MTATDAIVFALEHLIVCVAGLTFLAGFLTGYWAGRRRSSPSQERISGRIEPRF